MGGATYFRQVLTNLGSFERGSSEWMTEAFLKTTKGDPEALLLILDTFVDTSREEIAAIDLPALVVTGAEDFDNGSAQELADAAARWALRRDSGQSHECGDQARAGRGDRGVPRGLVIPANRGSLTALGRRASVRAINEQRSSST